jgi:hypothetical protein
MYMARNHHPWMWYAPVLHLVPAAASFCTYMLFADGLPPITFVSFKRDWRVGCQFLTGNNSHAAQELLVSTPDDGHLVLLPFLCCCP